MPPRPSTRVRPSPRPSQRGIALVLVLAFLVLLVGLVVAFFMMMTGEVSQSSVYSDQVKARQLADSAMNLVTAQIVEATKGYASNADGSPDYSRPLAWASQPGAIRTFDTSGNAVNVFKLYSAERLVATSAEFAQALGGSGTQADVATDWAAHAALYTDLNAPVTNAAGDAIYPIADPAAWGHVEGFAISGAPTTGTTNPLPMPARWLYVLENGAITAPDAAASTGDRAVWSGSGPNVPSKDNRIVGRIAFWTDDETAKVNVNTASEGTFWDTPRTVTTQEKDLGKFQPANKEFQRYPGHPAMTSLAPVLFATSATSTPALTAAQRDALYAIAPRVASGGSNAGTAIATGAVNTGSPGRLYANVDELIYDDTRGPQVAAAGLTRAKLEQARFFLTANSRAPETTLFNTPRVSVWPLDASDSTTRRTPFDRLAAFCTTINGKLYSFTRSDPTSPTADFPGEPTTSPQTGINRNRNLYAYLQRLTSLPFPGFGGSLAGKYPLDRDQILTEIFDYIRCTNQEDSSSPDPGFVKFGARSRTPVGPYNPDLGKFGDQTGTSVLGINQIVPIRIGDTQGFGRFPVITEVGLHFICTADSGTGAAGGVLGSNVVQNNTLGGTLLPANRRRVEAMLVLETFEPSQGYPPAFHSLAIRVRGLGGIAVDGANLGFPADATSRSLRDFRQFWGGRVTGGSMDNRSETGGKTLPARGSLPAEAPYPLYTNAGVPASVYQFPFISIPVTVSTAGGKTSMNLTGATLTIDVYAGNNANVTSQQPVRTYTITIPDGPLPIPSLVTTATALPPSHAEYLPREGYWTFAARGNGLAAANGLGRLARATATTFNPLGASFVGSGSIPQNGDVLRTFVPEHSDYRLLAAGGAVNFVPMPGTTASTSLRHTLSTSVGESRHLGSAYDPKGLAGSGVTYGATAMPDVPIFHPNSATNGDWDNGASLFLDGAFINMPDEGNSYRATAADTPYFENNHLFAASGQTFFSPNRQMPSAGMLGSLPTGVKSNAPFQTLLFRPQPNHSQSPQSRPDQPPDHLILDLFWMPVVEPYAISEPFSTAGKTNLNYAIVPYTYIRRATGLAALLRSEKVLAIPNSAAADYKNRVNPAASVTGAQFRKAIDIPETLSQFDAKFAAGGIFKSGTEICDLHLVPSGQTLAAMGAFWDNHRLTGDNARERPYANLLGRVTTKSNTFTIHYKVQVLRQRKQANDTDFASWEEGRDSELAELRGSTIVERYIDPNDPRLPDFATDTNPATANIDDYYRIRTVTTKRFSP